MLQNKQLPTRLSLCKDQLKQQNKTLDHYISQQGLDFDYVHAVCFSGPFGGAADFAKLVMEIKYLRESTVYVCIYNIIYIYDLRPKNNLQREGGFIANMICMFRGLEPSETHDPHKHRNPGSPGRFQEGIQEGKSVAETVTARNPQSRKLQEGSRKDTRKVETRHFQNPQCRKVQEGHRKITRKAIHKKHLCFYLLSNISGWCLWVLKAWLWVGWRKSA